MGSLIHMDVIQKKNRKTWEPPLFFITHPELLLFESKDAERRKHWDEPRHISHESDSPLFTVDLVF